MWRESRKNSRIVTSLIKSKNYKLYETDAKTFYDIFKEFQPLLGKTSLNVSIYSFEKFLNGDGDNFSKPIAFYLNKDGRAGAVVTENGEIMSLFNGTGRGGFLNDMLSTIINDAITNKGIKAEGIHLSHFGGKKLGDKYTKYSKLNGRKLYVNIDAVFPFDKAMFLNDHGIEQLSGFLMGLVDSETAYLYMGMRYYTEEQYTVMMDKYLKKRFTKEWITIDN
jgi:hypothetical protein